MPFPTMKLAGARSDLRMGSRGRGITFALSAGISTGDSSSQEYWISFEARSGHSTAARSGSTRPANALPRYRLQSRAIAVSQLRIRHGISGAWRRHAGYAGLSRRGDTFPMAAAKQPCHAFSASVRVLESTLVYTKDRAIPAQERGEDRIGRRCLDREPPVDYL